MLGQNTSVRFKKERLEVEATLQLELPVFNSVLHVAGETMILKWGALTGITSFIMHFN